MLLARTLGFPSRRAMYRTMTAADLAEWEQDFAISPWDEKRQDLRFGILCSLIDACHRTNGSPRSPIDYMPFAKRSTSTQSVASMKDAVNKFLGKKNDAQ